jgi:hypothetical protein
VIIASVPFVNKTIGNGDRVPLRACATGHGGKVLKVILNVMVAKMVLEGCGKK